VIVTEGQPAALKAALGRESINIVLKDSDAAEAAAARLSDMFDRTQVDRRTVRLYRANAAEAVPSVVNRLTDGLIEVVSLTLTQPTLDDVFLKATGQRFENETETESK
jgi:ABC-2 type transport system ATP-binding protein